MKSVLIKSAKKLFYNFGYELVNAKKKDDTALYIKLYGNESVSEKRFYNVCGGGHLRYGGGFSHPCWRNLDLLRSVEGWNNSYNSSKDIPHDLLSMESLPIENNTAEIIQSQYSIEHISDEAALFFLKEANRALKPGGILKIVVPNIELDYLAYTNNDKSYFAIDSMSLKKNYEAKSRFKTPFNQASFEQIFLSRFASNATIIHGGNNPNRIDDKEFKHSFATMDKEDAFTHCSSKCSVEVQKEIRYNHINWWNHNKLLRMLEEAGFKQNSILAPGQSSTPVLRNNQYFDNLWNHVALFVESKKDEV